MRRAGVWLFFPVIALAGCPEPKPKRPPPPPPPPTTEVAPLEAAPVEAAPVEEPPPPPAEPPPPRFERRRYVGKLPAGVREGSEPGSYVNEKDGSALVWIPRGKFVMGNDRGDADESPTHEVYFEHGYFIGQHEVTLRQWKTFCAATKRAAPEGPNDHPVTGVSWFDACDYCAWAGLRLPTEAEWEHAGRSDDGRLFAWGDWLDVPPANFAGAGDGHEGIAPVGSLAGGVSPFGCHDLGGNALEWVHDWHYLYPSREARDPVGSPDGDERVLRGGGHTDRIRRLTWRGGAEPLEAPPTAGFRVARSSPDGGPTLVVPKRDARRPTSGAPKGVVGSYANPHRLEPGSGHWIEGKVTRWAALEVGDKYQAWIQIKVDQPDMDLCVHQPHPGVSPHYFKLVDARRQEVPWHSAGGGGVAWDPKVSTSVHNYHVVPGLYFVVITLSETFGDKEQPYRVTAELRQDYRARRQ